VSRASAIGLVVLSLIWGGSFVMIKIMLEQEGPIAVAWERLGGGAVLILIVAAVGGRRMPSLGRYPDIAVVAALASAAPYILIPWGEQQMASGLAAILNAATPFFAAIFAHRFLTAERLTRLRAAGLALGFAGVIVVIGPGLLRVASQGTRGQLAVVLASACYGAGAVYLRRRLLDVDSTVLAGLQSAIAFALITPLLLSVEGLPPFADMTRRVIIAMLALALLSSGFAIMIYYWLLSHLHAAQAALVTYLVPVTAVFWGWLVLRETVSPAVIPGVALIMAGIYLVNRQPRQAIVAAIAAASVQVERPA
jgi:drug/metabolite transporter (DMT)-like permease